MYRFAFCACVAHKKTKALDKGLGGWLGEVAFCDFFERIYRICFVFSCLDFCRNHNKEGNDDLEWN